MIGALRAFFGVRSQAGASAVESLELHRRRLQNENANLEIIIARNRVALGVLRAELLDAASDLALARAS